METEAFTLRKPRQAEESESERYATRRSSQRIPATTDRSRHVCPRSLLASRKTTFRGVSPSRSGPNHLRDGGIMRRNVAIVGGGPGGLFTALLLGREMATPPRITLFEASNRLGGKIVTGSFHSGGHYEAGAAELYDYSPIDTDPLRDLVEEFGLPIIEMGGAAAVLDGRVIGNLE